MTAAVEMMGVVGHMVGGKMSSSHYWEPQTVLAEVDSLKNRPGHKT